ncbi:MAG: GNAT family N-acetyltransferase [Propioniciclava sp.]|jgi:predicted N-acetyltransferase YhbS|nr:GNAT family N-acetyltransferase [Propioniciclava sp.]
MTVTTRPATPADAAAIQRLNRDDLGYDHPLDAVVAALADALASPRDLVMVAEVDGDVVGYVHAEEHRLLYLDLLVNVMGIAVLADAQGRGAGRALMEHVEGWARERGASGLRLVSGEARAGAHAFYERLGFVTTKKQLNYRKPL